MKMRLLVVLLSLVFSQAAFTAEKCSSSDGRVMICFEEKKAEELLHIVQNEYPSLKRQIELLNKEIELQKKLQEYVEKQKVLEVEELKQWKVNYQNALKQVEENKKEIDFRKDIGIYTHIGVFILGSLVGGGVMYGSSLLVSNTIQGE